MYIQLQPYRMKSTNCRWFKAITSNVREQLRKKKIFEAKVKSRFWCWRNKRKSEGFSPRFTIFLKYLQRLLLNEQWKTRSFAHLKIKKKVASCWWYDCKYELPGKRMLYNNKKDCRYSFWTRLFNKWSKRRTKLNLFGWDRKLSQFLRKILRCVCSGHPFQCSKCVICFPFLMGGLLFLTGAFHRKT